MEKLKLKRVGKNFWSAETFQDEHGCYYQDVNGIIHRNSPTDDPDGEPECPLNREYEVINPKTEREMREEQHEFDYMMCSRISQDIRGYLHGDKMDCRLHNERNIYAGNAKRALEHLKEHWAKIPADLKPDWLTQEEIDGWTREIA